MAKEYFNKDKRLTDLINEVINENFEFSHLKNLTIEGITHSKKKKSKSKIVYADTEKLNDKHNFLTGIDFIITFYPESRNLDNVHLKRLIFHELLHVGYDAEKEKKYIVPHDIEDFKVLIDKYGTDWLRN